MIASIAANHALMSDHLPVNLATPIISSTIVPVCHVRIIVFLVLQQLDFARPVPVNFIYLSLHGHASRVPWEHRLVHFQQFNNVCLDTTWSTPSVSTAFPTVRPVLTHIPV